MHFHCIRLLSANTECIGSLVLSGSPTQCVKCMGTSGEARQMWQLVLL